MKAAATLFQTTLLTTLLTLIPLASAHFQLTYPPSRGNNDQTQATSPCGGLDSPSTIRTNWGLTGGQLKFEAGHDEADTAVYLAVGNNPAAADFTVILANKFKQVGLGTFCWNSLGVPNGTAGVKEGVNATIQVVQAGHTGGGLYNCADITFVSSPPSVSACSNASGVSAESLGPSSSASASSQPSATGKPSSANGSGVGGMMVGVVVAVAAAMMGGLLF